MKSKLVAHIPAELRDEMRGLFISSRRLRNEMIDFLSKQIDDHHRAMAARSNYESPSWAYAQADSIGYVRALHECIGMLSDEKEEKVKKPRGRPKKSHTSPEKLI